MAEMLPEDSDHDAIRDLLGAYALGAVDADERRQVEAHLQSCADCREELVRHTAVIAGLERVAADLGPEQAAHLMDVDGKAHSGVHEPPSPQHRASPRRRGVVIGLGIGALLSFVVSAATVTVMTRQRLERVEGRLARATQIEQVVALATDRDSRVVHLSTAVEGVSLDVVVVSDGNALVWKNRLPLLPAQRSYFLWAVVAGQWVPIGRLDPGGEPQVMHVPAGANAMVVTEERSTGQPEGTRTVVAGVLGAGP